jgi:hypothetical protein
MSSIKTFNDVANEKKRIDMQSLSEDQRRRMKLKLMKEMLLAVADRSTTSDADMQRLMRTGFAEAFGPYMRALFPTVVTSALHLPMHAPEYRAKLSADEEDAATATPLPMPPHHFMRDFQCTVGLSEHTLHQDPRINHGTCHSFIQSAFILQDLCCFLMKFTIG